MVLNDTTRRKEFIMTASKSAKSAPKAKAVVHVAELMVTGEEMTYDALWKFVQEHAGGNEANVKLVPLENVYLTSDPPVTFPNGCRV